jgi:bacterioferritin-associated ferredoxin
VIPRGIIFCIERMNSATIAQKLNRALVRIRQWIKKHPNALKRVGMGLGGGTSCCQCGFDARHLPREKTNATEYRKCFVHRGHS